MIKVLDRGFVEVVDYLGDDKRAVEAARVSYLNNDNTQNREMTDKDKKLAQSLMERGHFSPFEHLIVTFHVKAPIFVARQWFRHRIACVAGDTELYFDLPLGTKNGKTKLYKKSIAEIYSIFYQKQDTISHNKQEIKNMKLRHANEITHEIDYTNIEDVHYNGKQHIYEVELENGKKIKTSLRHRFFTEDGWIRLGDALKTETNTDHTIKSFDNSIRFANNGLPIKDELYVCQGDSIKDSRLKICFTKVENVKYAGYEDTYDITVSNHEEPNYIANGFVIHNSYNEVSRRYTSKNADEFYIPDHIRTQSKTDKQGSVRTSNKELEAEAIDIVAKAYETAYRAYEGLLSKGVAREMARIILPVGQYTEFYFTANFRELMHFLNLRADSHAQWEIQEYAKAIAEEVGKIYPYSYTYFLENGYEGDILKVN